MPSYDYRCDANGRTVEVQHRLTERMQTWGELCKRAGIHPGRTPLDAPVVKLITGGYVNVAGRDRPSTKGLPPCEAGVPCCGGGACGFE